MVDQPEMQGFEAEAEEAAEVPQPPEEETQVGSLSLEEAFEAASAGVSDGDEPESATAEEKAGADEGGEEPAEKAGSVESELDRIYSHIRAGTIDKLPPHLRGRAAAIQREIAEAARREYEEEQKTVSQLKERFLELAALRETDPEEFHRLMWDTPESPKLRDFYETMRREFPELSPENPDAQRAIDVEGAKREAVVQVFQDMYAAVREATGLGDDSLQSVADESKGPWDFLARAIQATVQSALEKERAKIREEERKAALMETQREYLTRSVVVPKAIPQHVAQAAQAGPLSLTEAFELAMRSQGNGQS